MRFATVAMLWLLAAAGCRSPAEAPPAPVPPEATPAPLGAGGDPLGENHPWLAIAASKKPEETARALAGQAVAREPGVALRDDFFLLGDFDRNFTPELAALVEKQSADGRISIYPAIFDKGRTSVRMLIADKPLADISDEGNQFIKIDRVGEFSKLIDENILAFQVTNNIDSANGRKYRLGLSCYVYNGRRLFEGFTESLNESEGYIDSPVAKYERTSNYTIADLLSALPGKEILIYDRLVRTARAENRTVLETTPYPIVYSYNSRAGFDKISGPGLFARIFTENGGTPRTLPFFLLIAARVADARQAEELRGRISAIAGARFITATRVRFAELEQDGYFIARPFIDWEEAVKYQTILEDRGAETRIISTRQTAPAIGKSADP